MNKLIKVKVLTPRHHILDDDNEGGDRCCFEDQCSIHCHCGSYRHRACHSQFSQLGRRFDYFANLTFAHIVVSLSIGASGTILESLRMNFPHWSHWLQDERGTDTVTVMERHKNSALMHQPPLTFWPIWMRKVWRSRIWRDYPGSDHKVYPSSRVPQWDENS